jgi:hypothetical protein
VLQKALSPVMEAMLKKHTWLAMSVGDAVSGGVSRINRAFGNAGVPTSRAFAEVDAIPPGWLGGKPYSADKLRQLEGYLQRRGVTLKVGDEFVPPGAAGAFARDGSELLLPSNPTKYVVWHEMNHYLQFRSVGKEAYMNLPRGPSFNAPEQFVFDSLENSPKRWNALTFEEQQHAITYIENVGGMR